MISFVKGDIAQVGLTEAVVEVGGVGLLVQCTPNTLADLRVGEPSRLATSMVVREDSMTLYGFTSDDERHLFELLQTASGVGPKLAQAMLAVHSPQALREAIVSENVKTLTMIPGIGQKGAQRVILELKDRVGPVHGPTQTAAAGATGWRPQVADGLIGLGWSAKEADKACESVAGEAEAMSPPDIGQLLRLALRSLSKA